MLSPIRIKGDNTTQLTMSQIKSSEQSSWPELVGLPAKEAEDKLRYQHKNLMCTSCLKKRVYPCTNSCNIQVLPEDAMVTMDYREDRVRIFTNKEGNVARPPMIG